MKQFYADGLGNENVLEVIRVDTIFGDESLQNMEALWRQHIDTPVLEQIGRRIRSVLDKTGVHKVLTHSLGHVPGHGERGCSSGGYYSGRFSGIRPTI